MEPVWCSLSETAFGNQVHRLAQAGIIPVHLFQVLAALGYSGMGQRAFFKGIPWPVRVSECLKARW